MRIRVRIIRCRILEIAHRIVPDGSYSDIVLKKCAGSERSCDISVRNKKFFSTGTTPVEKTPARVYLKKKKKEMFRVVKVGVAFFFSLFSNFVFVSPLFCSSFLRTFLRISASFSTTSLHSSLAECHRARAASQK